MKADGSPWCVGEPKGPLSSAQLTQCPGGFKDHLQGHRGQAGTRGSGKATACFRTSLPTTLWDEGLIFPFLG